MSTEARPAADSPPTLAKLISDSDAAQLIGLAANVAGVISYVGALYSFIDGLTQPSSSDILSAIDALAQTLNSDFQQLGDLINEQTQTVVNTVNRDSMATALARSDTATERVEDYLNGNDNDALDTAKTESIGGLTFFFELGLTAPGDLAFFLPGLLKAGTARVFTLSAEPPAAREAISVMTNDVQSMVTLLGSMIGSIESTVNAKHQVVAKSHVQQCSVIAQVVGSPALGQPHRNITVIDGYYHVESGIDLAFFDAQQGNPPCEQPSPYQAAALAAANQARAQGVSDELALLGIPNFQQVLQSWQTLLASLEAFTPQLPPTAD